MSACCASAVPEPIAYDVLTEEGRVYAGRVDLAYARECCGRFGNEDFTLRPLFAGAPFSPDARTQLRTLQAAGLTFADCVAAFATPDEALRARAEAHAFVADGVLELDDQIVASPGADAGCYVSAWLWVAK